MKKLLAALAATTALAAPAMAEDITEFRIGILGGDNVQSRLNNYQCFADYIAEELNVEVKLFTPADYNGVIQGLLGGTLAFPSAGWDGRDLPPPGPADWSEIGEVRHVFTHFSLTMRVMLGELSGRPERGRLVPLRHIDRKALPGLMRKVWDLARAEIAA